MKTWFVLVLALVLASAAAPPARGQAAPPQKPPAAQPPPAQPPAGQPPAGQKPSAPAPRVARPASNARLSVTLFVTDSAGAPISGVQVKATGPIDREGATTREGSVKLQGLRAGEYRLHFEADGFV